MFTRRIVIWTLVIGGATGTVGQAQTPFDPAARVATVANLVDDSTLAIAHVDLGLVDFAAAGQFVRQHVPQGLLSAQEQTQFQNSLTMATATRTKFLEAGAADWYGVFRLKDADSAANGPPVSFAVAVSVQAGKDPEAVKTLLGSLLPGNSVVQKNLVITTPPYDRDSLNSVRPKKRDEFVQAFQAAGNTAAQVVFAPSPSTRQLNLGLPPDLGPASTAIAALQQKLQWATLTLNAPPSPAVALIVQMEDKESAELIQSGVKLALEMATRRQGLQQQLPALPQMLELLTPKLRGENQLRIVLSEKNGGVKSVTDSVVASVIAARKAAESARSSNNLKQIGLACHNYHDRHKKLPPQASLAADGKKLLSWRVHLLPYLEASQLYEQFHLDEAWDSPHNRKLIEQMPAVYASPNMPPDAVAKGMTNYLAPVAPGTIFGGTEGTSFRQVLDGLSNTIMVLETLPTKAVIWTKPDDLPVDEKNPLVGLTEPQGKGFSALLGDGAVRLLKPTVDPKTLWLLFQMSDGQPVSGF